MVRNYHLSFKTTSPTDNLFVDVYSLRKVSSAKVAILGLYAWWTWSVAFKVSKNLGSLASRSQSVEPSMCGSCFSGLTVSWAAETGGSEGYLWDQPSGESRMLSILCQTLKLTLPTFCKSII